MRGMSISCLCTAPPQGALHTTARKPLPRPAFGGLPGTAEAAGFVGLGGLPGAGH